MDDTARPSLRLAIERTLNDPSYSRLASFISNVVLVAIIVSTSSFVVGTMDAFEGAEWLNHVEVAVVAIFTAEYVSRFAVHYGSRVSFVVQPLNLVDLLAILPFYAELAFGAGNTPSSDVLRVLRVLRVVRIFRVFKLANFVESMRVVGTCMAESTDALGLLVFFLCIAVLIFASLLYYAESGVRTPASDGGADVFLRSDGSESPFTSIPATFWWAIVTMTTVGYGDSFPVEPAGKLIATFAMLTGVLVLALPISVIGSNFTDAYAASLKARAYHELLEAPSGGDGGASPPPSDVFSHAAQRVDAHAAELQRLLDATSHAFTRGREPAARALGVQFDVQCAAVQQALGGLSRLLSNKQVLEVLLREEGARLGAEKARAKLGRERALV